MNHNCSTCGACHFAPIAGTRESGLQCRRRPPQILLVPHEGPVIGGNVRMNVNAWWPVVRADDFCCEWIDKREAGRFIGAPDAGLMS